MLNFQEDLLQYVWRLQHFNFQNLRTTKGEEVLILHPGYQNTHSGPDFSAAKIRMNDVEWIGNVEIHIKSSDWNKHKHFNDPAYDNIILHVVYEEDAIISRKDGSIIPCIALKGLIPRKIFDQYFQLQDKELWIPCANQIRNVPEITKALWLESLTVDRLKDKSREIKRLLEYTNYDWEYCLYIILARYFGANVNKEPFEQLAKSISLDKVNKNRHDTVIIEALFYGQAGFLDSPFRDVYPNKLKKEYDFLKHKYQISPIPVKLWKFFRLRPMNFPTIRIAQFTDLIIKNQHLSATVLNATSIQTLRKLFDVEIHEYWEEHYVFEKESEWVKKSIGSDFQDVIIMNALLPFMFVYGKLRKEEIYAEQAIDLLSTLAPEKNKVITNWKTLGYMPQNAADTQALIQLKQHYCSVHRCLQCAIGHQVMK